MGRVIIELTIRTITLLGVKGATINCHSNITRVNQDCPWQTGTSGHPRTQGSGVKASIDSIISPSYSPSGLALGHQVL